MLYWIKGKPIFSINNEEKSREYRNFNVILFKYLKDFEFLHEKYKILLRDLTTGNMIIVTRDAK